MAPSPPNHPDGPPELPPAAVGTAAADPPSRGVPRTAPPAAPVAAPRPDGGALAESAANPDGVMRWMLAGSSSWLLSLCVHFVVLMLLAAWTLPTLPSLPLPELISRLSPEFDEALDEAPLLEFDDSELEAEPVEFEVQPEVDAALEAVSVADFQEAAAPSFQELSDFGLTSAFAVAPADSPGIGQTEAYGRGRASRALLVRTKGGNKASEVAVAMALDWLARHQNPDGSWSLRHDRGQCNGRCDHPGLIGATPADSVRGATGLALLPFLGAGQSHLTGKHQETIARGLAALVAMGRPDGNAPGLSWSDGAGRMYSHGVSAIVLTEALGMTGDDSLRPAAQAALDYIAYAQGPRGGWRYRPRTLGDTSVAGWQIMALKSGFLAKLNVPEPVAKRAYSFLDSLERDDGAGYAYFYEGVDENGNRFTPGPRPSTTAVGLLSRMYLGWEKNNPALRRGVERLAGRGPSETDFYFNYYAAQVLFQHTSGEGPAWDAWNTRLRDQLVAQQDTQGHARGSWYVEGPHADAGGRLYLTSLAAMTLEVYYRYLPIYQLNTASLEFPE